MHDAIALLLHHAAVQRLCDEAVRVERIGQFVYLDARAAEHDRRPGALEIENPAEGIDLLPPADDVNHLPDAGQLAGSALLLGDLDPGGILQVPPSDAEDARREGGRKQSCLPLFRRLRDDGVDVFCKPHVEHLVGLVEDQHLDVLQIERRPAKVIERASRRGDNHFGAASQRADLVIHRSTAIKRHHRQVAALRVLVQRLCDLHRQLPRRHEHECARLAAGALGAPQAIEQGQREGGGLARAGRGLAKHVGAGQQHRNRFLLDGCRFFVAECGDGGHECLGQTERREAAGLRWVGRLHRTILSESITRYAAPLLDQPRWRAVPAGSWRARR